MFGRKTGILIPALILAMAVHLCGSEWTHWRGPNQDGTSPETGLPESWSLDGKNLAWRVDFIARATPIVMNGKVYAIGRTGAGQTMQRVVACYAVKDGKLIWEKKDNVTHTTVPFTRVGWASLGGDPETGNVYVLGVDGLFTCHDGKTGDIVWQHSLGEEFHRFSGYGGRTNTPVVDQDLVHISFWTWSAWGERGPPKPRFVAYDKKTGDLVWEYYLPNTPDDTNYSNPVIATINGVRAMICGAPDGSVYALQASTGKPIWSFAMTKAATQTSVVVDGNKVYATHGAENFDSIARGRVVCYDMNGQGDISKTNEIWRADGVEVGYASPAIHDGRLYVINNAGNLIAFDAATGEEKWTSNLGTVGKGSPVVADGKIYATEVNGSLHIVKLGDTGATSLDRKQIAFDELRAAEVYASPAVAYGRVFFATENGLFCIGDKNAPIRPDADANGSSGDMMLKAGKATHLQIVPAADWIHTDGKIDFSARWFDEKGVRLKEQTITFELEGLKGSIDNNGVFKPDASAGIQAGHVVAKSGELVSKARIQVTPALPITIDFDNMAADKNPPYWPVASKFMVKKDESGNNFLLKPPSSAGLNRHNLFLGPPDMTGYTIQADLKAEKVKRRSPDMGVIANRYYFVFMTKKNRLQLLTWAAELERFSKEVDYEWNPDLWYTMKLQVDVVGSKAIVKGKIWPRDETEPAEWTITAEDALGNNEGSPALYGDSATDIYFDNVKITRSR